MKIPSWADEGIFTNLPIDMEWYNFINVVYLQVH